MQWFTKALGQYADFEGRARRTEYWMFTLFYTLFVFVAVLLDVLIGLAIGFPVPVLTIAYVLGTFVPALAVMVRRLHDTDRSGWWYFISLVPFGSIVLLVFACSDGTPGPNRYGPSPKPVPAYYPPTYAGQPYPGQPYSGQPYSGQPYSGQPYSGQPHA